MTEQEQAERAAVVAEAKTWLGTKYHHMGRVKGAGVDCGMILLEVFERCGLIPHVELPYYPPDWAFHRNPPIYLDEIQKYGEIVPGPLLPGDIVLYKYGRHVSHASIYLGNNMVLHAYVDRGVVVERESAPSLKTRQAAIFRLKAWC